MNLQSVIWGVFAVSIVGGCLLRLFPRNSKLMSYVRFLLSLILLGMMLSPIADVLAGLRADNPFGSLLAEDGGRSVRTYYEDTVSDLAQEQAARSLCTLIAAETGIAVEDMAVSFATETALCDEECEITITQVSVTLYCRAHRIAGEKIRALVERTLYCPCTVLYEEAENA